MKAGPRPVNQAVAGHDAATRAVHDLHSTIPDQDLLHARLMAVLATAEPERLRAFCRYVQKRLETLR